MRGNLWLSLVAALVAVAGADEARAQVPLFDLVCVGWHKDDFDQSLKQPYQTRVRVDLVSGRYCMDACTELNRIERVSDTEITLIRLNSMLGGGGAYRDWSLNRAKGLLMGIERGRGTEVVKVWMAHCKVEGFSGFESAQKF